MKKLFNYLGDTFLGHLPDSPSTTYTTQLAESLQRARRMGDAELAPDSDLAEARRRLTPGDKELELA